MHHWVRFNSITSANKNKHIRARVRVKVRVKARVSVAFHKRLQIW